MSPMLRRTPAWLVVLLTGLLGLLIAGCSLEPVFSYQGLLTDPSGNPVADGSYNAVFRLYTVASGGSAVYTQTRTISVQDGLFDTSVGGDDVPTEIYANQLYLEVTIEGETLSPRQALRGAPYAFSLASGALVQGSEAITRTLGTRNDTGAALAVVNANEEDGGHGLIGINNSDRQDAAALAGIAQNDSYGGYFLSENYRGIYAESDPLWYAGYFEGDINVTGSCNGCFGSLVARNVGNEPLRPGDLVGVVGVEQDADLGTTLLQVRRATTSDDVIVGVADGAMRRSVHENPSGANTSGFDPAGGDAAAGGYLSVVTSGLARVRAGGAVELGDYLGAGSDGAKVQAAPGGLAIRAMGTPEADGLVWALLGQ